MELFNTAPLVPLHHSGVPEGEPRVAGVNSCRQIPQLVRWSGRPSTFVRDVLSAAAVCASLAVAGQARGDTSLVFFGFESSGGHLSANETGTTLTPPLTADSGVFASNSTFTGVHASPNTVYNSSGSGLTGSYGISSNYWNTGDYWQFNTSSTGYNVTQLGFTVYGSNAGPKTFELEYSTTAGGANGTYSNLSAYNALYATQNLTFNLASVTALDNDPNLYFRLVDVEPTNLGTSNTISGNSNYNNSGYDRLDNVFVNGISNLLHPQNLLFDPLQTGTGASEGSGTFDNSTTDFYNPNTSGDVAFNSSNPDNPTFGAGTGSTTPQAVTLGANVTAGYVTFAANSPTYTISGGSGYTLTVNNAITANSSATISAPLALGGSIPLTTAAGATLTISGAISGANALTVGGSGTTVLSGNSSFTGGVTVTGGVLSVSSDANLGSTSTEAAVSLANGTLLASAPFTSGRAISLGGNGGTIDDGGNIVSFTGGLSGLSGSTGLTKNGSGTLSITLIAGTNLGALTVNAGTLDIPVQEHGVPYFAFGSPALASTIAANSSVVLGTDGSPLEAELQGGGTYSGTGSYVIEPGSAFYTYSTGTATVANPINILTDANGGAVLGGYSSGRVLTLNGNITDAGSPSPGTVVYGGTAAAGGYLSGKVILNGTNTYTGGSTIVAGTVVANSANSLGSGTVTVTEYTSGTATPAGTLAGSGYVIAPVTLAAGGTITAGSGATSNDSTGVLHVTNTVTAASGSFYVVKLNGSTATADPTGTGQSATPGGGNDELVVSDLSGAGNLTVTPVVLTGTSFAPGTYSFLIADATTDATAFASLNNTAVTLPAGSFYSGSTATLETAGDAGGSGEDLYLDITAATPEPTSLLLVGLAATPLVLGRRRRVTT